MMNYGRVEYVTEIEAAQIRLYNHAKQSEAKRHIREIRTELEDVRIAKACGITVEELNQRMIG